MIALATRLHLGFYDGADRLSIDALVYIHPLARLFEFVLGMAAGEAWRRFGAAAARIPVLVATLLELGALALGLAGLTVFKDSAAAAFARGEISPATLKWLVASGSAPCFAVVAVVFAAGRGTVARLLSWRPFVVLGEISFALYLCHVLLFRALTTSGSIASYGGIGAQFAVYCAMVLGLSYALHMLVERPCQAALLARLTRRPAPLTPG
jgi:peptidoglycan/LPS O-acetylase OafA/YrhL